MHEMPTIKYRTLKLETYFFLLIHSKRCFSQAICKMGEMLSENVDIHGHLSMKAFLLIGCLHNMLMQLYRVFGVSQLSVKSVKMHVFQELNISIENCLVMQESNRKINTACILAHLSQRLIW